MTWIAGAVKMAEKEVQGICEHIAEKESPAASKVSQRLVQSFMRKVKTRKLNEQYPLLVAMIQDVMAESALTSWSSLKKRTG